MDCLFCKIINKELSSDIIYEDDEVIVFKDIHPKAPFHVLIVPKKHIGSISDLEDKDLAAKIIFTAKKITITYNGEQVSIVILWIMTMIIYLF